MNRQISKIPDTITCFNERLVFLLTELCFGVATPYAYVNLVFAYGTPFFFDQVALKIAYLLDNKLTNNVMIAGGVVVPPLEPFKAQPSEASMIYGKLKNMGNDVNIYLEENSQNTLENVINSLKILDFSNVDKIGFIYPSHAARRGYLTLRKFLPNAQIFQYTYDAHYPGDEYPISKDNWHIFDLGKKRVWGEFLRIKEYGQRGDIAYHEEIDNLIKQIDLNLKKTAVK
jgi:hypothetical protein